MSYIAFSKEDKEARLESLDKRERQILYRVIKGENLPQVAGELLYEIGTVRNTLTEVYRKLGLANLEIAEKRKALKKEYESLIKRFKTEDEFLVWVRPKQDTPERPVSVEAVLKQARSEPAPPPPPIRTIPRRNVLPMVVLAIILFFIIIFVVRNNHRNPTSPDVTTTILPRISSTVALSPTTTSTPTHRPTSTKTFTPRPTKTPEPTATPTLPPTPFPLPFSDQFSTGIDLLWNLYGEGFIVDGKFTTNDRATLSIGNVGWKDYDIEFAFTSEGCFLQNYLGLRTKEPATMVAMKWDKCETVWFTVKDGVWNEIPGSNYHFRRGSIGTYFRDHSVRVKADGNKFVIYGDGEKGTELFIPQDQMSGFELGGVLVSITRDTYLDYFSITGQIPEIIVPTQIIETPSVVSTPNPITVSTVSLPFEDDFENSLNPHWLIRGVAPQVVNGELKSTGDTWIFIGDETWKDYRVEISTGGYNCDPDYVNPDNGSNVAVRVSPDLESFVALAWNQCAAEFYLKDYNTWTPIQETFSRRSPDMYNFYIIVQGNHFTVYTDYEKVTEYGGNFSSGVLPSGGVGFKLTWETTLKNIRVLPLTP
ncbi:MAG: LuxR C-terminal-related transcriptional regulator [Candidatus Helarchaeota archaeon]|nr:LuxR C-terminal-related transcriptional regulator [Candidatus Helarchaeota archaeon]